MWFHSLTPAGVRVMGLAHEEIKRLGYNFINTEELLLGLLADTRGTASFILRARGVTLEGMRVEVEKRIGRGSGNYSVNTDITQLAQQALATAAQKARECGSDLDTEHILFGILSTEGGLVGHLLRAFNVDPAALLKQVEEDMHLIVPVKQFLALFRPEWEAVARLSGAITDATNSATTLRAQLAREDKSILHTEAARGACLHACQELVSVTSQLDARLLELQQQLVELQADLQSLLASDHG